MATTVATLRADIIARLLVGSSTPEPTTALIDGWIRDAFRWAIGVLPPIKETTVSVTAGANSGSLTADEVYYVALEHKLLLPSEWEKRGDNIEVNISLIPEGGSLQVWYFNMPDLSGATIDTDAIFGADWLEMLVRYQVMESVELRMANIAASSDSAGHAQLARYFQERVKEEFARLEARRNTFVNLKEKALAARAAMGDGTHRVGAHSGFVNDSKILNALTEAS